MELRIAWFTEGGHQGRIPRNFRGMRNDSAWMCTLGAEHYNVHNIDWWKAETKPYDLGIVTIPKRIQNSILKRLEVTANKSHLCKKDLIGIFKIIH